MFDIIPDTWATETALNWFESGTCLLPDEKGKVRITTKRFDMFYGPQIATILILESDLQRLIGPPSKRGKQDDQSSLMRKPEGTLRNGEETRR